MLSFMFWGTLARHHRERRLTGLDRTVGAFVLVYCFLYLPYKFFKREFTGEAPVLTALTPTLAVTLFLIWISKTRNFRVLEPLGNISYSVYLLHAPLIVLISRAWPGPLSILGLGPLTEAGLFVGVMIGATLIISNISHQHLEKRFMARR